MTNREHRRSEHSTRPSGNTVDTVEMVVISLDVPEMNDHDHEHEHSRNHELVSDLTFTGPYSYK
jgi:hypothetical protein